MRAGRIGQTSGARNHASATYVFPREPSPLAADFARRILLLLVSETAPRIPPEVCPLMVGSDIVDDAYTALFERPSVARLLEAAGNVSAIM